MESVPKTTLNEPIHEIRQRGTFPIVHFFHTVPRVLEAQATRFSADL
jgi:hypothetical protein